jgi:hypothetical protein
MFYKPNYCCNCGEKIERATASFTDSTRFCDVCQHDFIWHRSWPKIFAALMAVFGVFGIGSYWRSGGEKPLQVSTRQFSANPSNAVKNPANNTPPAGSNSNVPAAVQAGNIQTNAGPGTSIKAPAGKAPSAPAPVEAAVYFCGAETKKGTPCSRRVKGGGRCWQHKGHAALLPPEKSLASQ